MAESASQVGPLDDQDDDLDIEQVRTLAEIFRGILGVALAAGVAGALVLGLGGRLAMRFAAVLNPAATGRGTENGNVIGDITLNGTIALVLFGGLLAGLLAAVVWVALSPWIPGRGVRRALLSVPIAIALGGLALVNSRNPDFFILENDLAIIAMLLGLVGLFGFCLALLEEPGVRRLPSPGTDPRRYAASAGFMVLVGGVLFLPLALAAYFGERACLCAVIPVPLAVPLLAVGGATVAWWAQRVQGRSEPSAPVRLVGRFGLLIAVALGTAILASEVADIPT